MSLKCKNDEKRVIDVLREELSLIEPILCPQHVDW